MKTWRILHDCRFKGEGVQHAMLGIIRMHNGVRCVTLRLKETVSAWLLTHWPRHWIAAGRRHLKKLLALQQYFHVFVGLSQLTLCQFYEHPARRPPDRTPRPSGSEGTLRLAARRKYCWSTSQGLAAETCDAGYAGAVLT